MTIKMYSKMILYVFIPLFILIGGISIIVNNVIPHNYQCLASIILPIIFSYPLIKYLELLADKEIV